MIAFHRYTTNFGNICSRSQLEYVQCANSNASSSLLNVYRNLLRIFLRDLREICRRSPLWGQHSHHLFGPLSSVKWNEKSAYSIRLRHQRILRISFSATKVLERRTVDFQPKNRLILSIILMQIIMNSVANGRSQYHTFIVLRGTSVMFSHELFSARMVRLTSRVENGDRMRGIMRIYINRSPIR